MKKTLKNGNEIIRKNGKLFKFGIFQNPIKIDDINKFYSGQYLKFNLRF